MCDLANQQLMFAVIDEKIAAREMFTAYDITLAARDKGMDERHGAVKNEVHNAFNQNRMDGYSRTLVDFAAKSGPVTGAWVYHDPADDPWQHPNAVMSSNANTNDDDDDDSIPSVNVGNIDSGNGISSSNNGSTDSATATVVKKRRITATGGDVDQFGRIRLSQKTLRDAGFRAGQEIHVTCDTQNQCLRIGPSSPHGDSIKYMIDQYTNARITLSRFKLNGTKFSVARDGNAIKVTIS